MDRELLSGDASHLGPDNADNTQGTEALAQIETLANVDMTEQAGNHIQAQESDTSIPLPFFDTFAGCPLHSRKTDDTMAASEPVTNTEAAGDDNTSTPNNDRLNNDEATDNRGQESVHNGHDGGDERPDEQNQDIAPPSELHDTHDGRRSSNRCPICISEPDAQHIDLSCGCRWCIDCLNGYFTSSLQNRSTFPPRCDRDTLEFGEVGGFLNDANVVRFFKVAEEYGAARPVFCSNKDCPNIEQAGASKFLGDAAVLPVEADAPLLLLCLECGLRTCASCRLPSDAHMTDEGLRCPENAEVQDLKKVVDDMGLPPTQCPQCAHLCERSEGCPVLTCVCGTKFCYICGQQAGEDEQRDCGCQDVATGWNAVNEELENDEDEDEDEFVEGTWPFIRPVTPPLNPPTDDLEYETLGLLEHGEHLMNAGRTSGDDEAVEARVNEILGNDEEQDVHADALRADDGAASATDPSPAYAGGTAIDDPTEIVADPTASDAGENEEAIVEGPSASGPHEAARDHLETTRAHYQQARQDLFQANANYWAFLNTQIETELKDRATLEARARQALGDRGGQARGQGQGQGRDRGRGRGHGAIFGGNNPEPKGPNELRRGLLWDRHGVGHRLGEDGDEPPARGGHGGRGGFRGWGGLGGARW